MEKEIRSRKGAKRLTEIPPDILVGLNQGTVASVNLVEALAVNFHDLLTIIAPEVPKNNIEMLLPNQKTGITQRMALAGATLLDTYGLVETINRFQTHLSDTVRGWVCYAIAQDPTLTIEQQLTFIKPLANDKHFGVREWAWLAVRPQLVSNLTETLALLTPWVVEESEYLRRFATEATRPRGVWCKQIPELKANPEWGLPLLTPLRSDALRYVQDSVGNWLNDASKTQPHWVKALCDEWLTESPTKETHYICKKALRPLK